MEPEQRNPDRGKFVSPSDRECPFCAEAGSDGPRARADKFLFLVLLVLALLFVITGFVAKAYHAKLRTIGEEWYGRGEADLVKGRPERAVTDFRNALAYARDDRTYRLRMGQALAAANREDEAQAYLMGLWRDEPGNGPVNLELARLAVRQHDISDASNFYHRGIYGQWDQESLLHRRDAHFEYAEFLLDMGKKNEAQAELMALAAGIPNDATLHSRLGSLFMRAGAYDRALAEFRQALRLSRGLDEALEGAGEAAFRMGDYQMTRRYLQTYVRRHPDRVAPAHLLETANLVVSADPYERFLSSEERIRRIMRAYQQAMKRLQQCAEQMARVRERGKQGLQALEENAQELRPKMRPSTLRRNPDLSETAMDIVGEIEEATARQCGPPVGLDQALLLIARKQGTARHE